MLAALAGELAGICDTWWGLTCRCQLTVDSSDNFCCVPWQSSKLAVCYLLRLTPYLTRLSMVKQYLSCNIDDSVKCYNNQCKHDSNSKQQCQYHKCSAIKVTSSVIATGSKKLFKCLWYAIKFRWPRVKVVQWITKVDIDNYNLLQNKDSPCRISLPNRKGKLIQKEGGGAG